MEITTSLETWWRQQYWLETTGVVTGLACVYLAAKNNILNWPLAIVSVVIYIFIFYEARLLADTGLQVYFLGMNIYGWYYWSNNPGGADKKPVVNITRREVWLSASGILIFTVFIGLALQYTTATLPYLDSFCTACSIIAQFFMARKVLQNWLLWIFVDIIYVGIYIYKNLHLTAIMYAVYLVIAIIGYTDWRKNIKALATERM